MRQKILSIKQWITLGNFTNQRCSNIFYMVIRIINSAVIVNKDINIFKNHTLHLCSMKLFTYTLAVS